jgi:hypothetical protein
MAITFRRMHAHPQDAQTEPELPTLPATFDQAELVAVAEYLAANAADGRADWDACARQLCEWADADPAALTNAAESTWSDHAISASSMLLEAADRAAH